MLISAFRKWPIAEVKLIVALHTGSQDIHLEFMRRITKPSTLLTDSRGSLNCSLDGYGGHGSDSENSYEPLQSD